MLVAETYRMLGHAQHDAHKYIPKRELARWRERDPIALFETHLREREFETEDLAGIRVEVERELDQAVDEALADPMPRPGDARGGVYSPSEPDITPWTRRVPLGYVDLSGASLEAGE